MVYNNSSKTREKKNKEKGELVYIKCYHENTLV